MVYINEISISNDSKKLQVNVETNVGASITSIKLWDHNTFKEYDQAIDLSFKLENINNKEVFIVESSEINIPSFTGIYFLEIESDYEEEEACISCTNTVLGVATNFNSINTLILDMILQLNVCDDFDNCNKVNKKKIINNTLMIEAVSRALLFGYYDEAIFIYNKILKLNKNITCNTCKNLATPTFNNGLNYAIINNTLILQ